MKNESISVENFKKTDSQQIKNAGERSTKTLLIEEDLMDYDFDYDVNEMYYTLLKETAKKTNKP